MPCPSETPLSRKLGLKPDARLALLDAPAGLPSLLAPLPEGVVVQLALDPETDHDLDVILAFQRDRAGLRERLARLTLSLATAGGLWIAWPKKSSGVSTDLSENIIREIGLASGLVDNKVCAIDATWSGLRFVRRLSDRPAARR
jgi:hypothetical protein